MVPAQFVVVAGVVVVVALNSSCTCVAQSSEALNTPPVTGAGAGAGVSSAHCCSTSAQL